MGSADLLSICISAFIAVFVLLSVLAIIMRITSWIFAHKEVRTNAAVFAAVASTINTIYPGTIITKVEEVS